MQEHIMELLFILLGIFIPSVITFNVWVVKRIYNLGESIAIDSKEQKEILKLKPQLEELKTWAIKTEAAMVPDKELRKELPILLEVTKQHGAELQTLREHLLLIQKEINTKLSGIVNSVQDIQSNCLMHKMVQAGKSDKLANFIKDELQKGSLE